MGAPCSRDQRQEPVSDGVERCDGSGEGGDFRFMGGMGLQERREGKAVGVCPIALCELGGSASGINPVTFK